MNEYRPSHSLSRSDQPVPRQVPTLVTSQRRKMRHLSPRSDQVIKSPFDTQRLPDLAIWLSYGGWPDTGFDPRHAVASEPTTSASNTLARAQEANSAIMLCAWRLFGNS